MRTGLIDEIAHSIDFHDLIFEAPSKSSQAWFVKQFGPEVNLGNIAPEEVIPLETLRLGLRGDTLKEILLADEPRPPRESPASEPGTVDRSADRRRGDGALASEIEGYEGSDARREGRARLLLGEPGAAERHRTPARARAGVAARRGDGTIEFEVA